MRKLIIPCEVAVKLYIDRNRCWVFFSNCNVSNRFPINDPPLTGTILFLFRPNRMDVLWSHFPGIS